MATTPLTSTKLARGTEAVLAAAGTATVLGAGNGIVVTCKRAHKLILMLKTVGTGTMTVKAGQYPPAESQGLGDKVTAAGVAGGITTIVVEAARHLQNAAGVAQVTVEFSATGDAFYAVEVPA